MIKLPAAMFVVDPKTDEIAVKEARKLRIPVIAICDTITAGPAARCVRWALERNI
jgi:ribosomal protein S2